MKLYATVSSERAKKGQGGNDRITVHVTGADRNTIAIFTVFPWRNRLDDGLPHICANVREDVTMSVETYKGEKQKTV